MNANKLIKLYCRNKCATGFNEMVRKMWIYGLIDKHTFDEFAGGSAYLEYVDSGEVVWDTVRHEIVYTGPYEV